PSQPFCSFRYGSWLPAWRALPPRSAQPYANQFDHMASVWLPGTNRFADQFQLRFLAGTQVAPKRSVEEIQQEVTPPVDLLRMTIIEKQHNRFVRSESVLQSADALLISHASTHELRA